MADENNSTEQNTNIITLNEQEQQILAQARAAYDEAIAQGQSIDQALNEASEILTQSDLDNELVTTTLNLWRGTSDLNVEQSNLDNVFTDATSEADDVEPTVETVPTGVLTNTNSTSFVSGDTSTSLPDVPTVNAVTEVNRVEITGMSTVGRNPTATQVSRPEQTELVEEVSITISANNPSNESQAVTLDVTPPTIRFMAAIDDVGSVAGALTSGDTTNDARLVLSGLVEAGSTVTIFNGTSVIGAATVTGTTWTYTATIEDGVTYQFNAVATDAAGNNSVPTDSFTVIGDMSISQPVIDLNSASDTGDSDSDNLTNDTTATFTLTNIDSDASAVEVFNGGVSLGFAEQVSGVWTFTATEDQLSEGENTLTVQVTDAAGNTSTSDDLTVTLDTTAFTNVESLTFSNDSGSSDTDLITNVASQTVTGTLASALAEGESLWIWQNDNDGWINATLAVNGTTVTLDDLTLESGTHTLKAQIRDAAGNVGEEQEWEYTLDTEKPITPTFALATDTGTSDSDGITNDATINVTLADDAVSWEYSLDGGNTWLTGSGSSFELGANATYAIDDIQVRQTDEAGNTSDIISNDSAITVDTTAPATELQLEAKVQLDGASDTSETDADPQITAVGSEGAYAVTWYGGNDDSGYSIFVQLFNAAGEKVGEVTQLDGASDTSKDDYSPQITAVGSEGAYVVTWYGSNDDDNDYSIFVQLFDATGEKVGEATQLDGASSTSGSDDSPQITAVGSDGAYAVTWYGVNDDGDGSIFVQLFNADGTVVTNNLINNSESVTVQSSEVGMAYLVLATEVANINSLADIEALADGQYNRVEITSANSDTLLSASGLADGTYVVYMVDAAGNLSVQTDETITIDSTVSTVVFALASDTGTSDSDGITNDATVTVTLDDDVASWRYSLDGGNTWNTGTGSSFELDADTTYAIGDIQVQQTDTAGNTSTASSNSTAITIDSTVSTVAFALASDTGTSDSDGITNDATVNVTLADDAASWEYSLDEGYTWNTGTGSSFELSADTFYSIGTIQVRQTDTAGNTSTASNSTAITVDTTTLAAPSFALASDTGTSDSDGITNDATVTVTLDDDVASWEFSLDGGSTWLTGSGSSFELGANATYAIGDIQVRQTDEAGNTSDIISNDSAITVDTTAPAAASEDAIVWSDDGQTVTLTFSEAIDVSKLTIESLTLADGLSFGDGASISASDEDNDGYADTFTITLGTDATATSDDPITVDKDSAIDAAGNTADDDIALGGLRSEIVVFDLTAGTSSSVDGSREFEAGVSYTIYIVVDSDNENVELADGYSWTGGANLGEDDEIVLVGNDSTNAVEGFYGRVDSTVNFDSYIGWRATSRSLPAFVRNNGSFHRKTSSTGRWEDLWTGTWASNPNGDTGNFSDRYKNALPSSVAQAVTWATPS